MNWLEKKSALVAGGASGIGRGVVEAYLEEGADVCVLDIDEARLGELQEVYPSVETVRGDATNLADNRRAVENTIESFDSLDILVCSIGVWDFSLGIRDLPPDKIDAAFNEIFEINVKSYLLAVKAALPALLDSKGNAVLTVSNAGFHPGGGGPLYTASKFATRGLVVELAYELAPAVRVNGVAPGGTMTDMTGVRALNQDGQSLSNVPGIADRMSTNPLEVENKPADHSWAYVYLGAEERAKNVTGTVIPTDGGLAVRDI